MQLGDYITPLHYTSIHFSLPGCYFPHVRSDSGKTAHPSFVYVYTQDDFFQEDSSICLSQFSNNLWLRALRELYPSSLKAWSYVILTDRSFAFDY